MLRLLMVGVMLSLANCATIATYEVSGRTPKPLLKKINPIWWWQNDDQQTVNEAPWYHPEWPQWQREIGWNVFRNPLMNFNAYVIGVADRNYTVGVVYGSTVKELNQRDDIGELGWQVSYNQLGFFRLPWFSYSGAVSFNLGWQPTGNFEIKLHPHSQN